MKEIYLDYAAATPLDPSVLRVMQPYFTDRFYNPSAPYQPARLARTDIENARAKVSRILGCKPSEVIFTAGASESINLALNLKGHVVSTDIEHPAVLENIKTKEHSLVGVDKNGLLDIEKLKALITPKTTLVSVAMINNEIGVVQNIKEIAEIIKKIRQKRLEQGSKTPIYLHTDASQAAGILDINVTRLGVDMMSLNGGKIYGPKQSGALYVNSHIKLDPIVLGGGQESGLRSGTENVAGIVGFAKALELAENKRKKELARLRELHGTLLKELETNFKNLVVFGGKKRKSPHILSVAIKDLDAERVLFALEEKGVLVATGSACAANKDTRSHVLTALGIEPSVIGGSLRFSFGRFTTSDDIKNAGKIIVMVIKKELERSGKKH